MYVLPAVKVGEEGKAKLAVEAPSSKSFSVMVVVVPPAAATVRLAREGGASCDVRSPDGAKMRNRRCERRGLTCARQEHMTVPKHDPRHDLCADGGQPATKRLLSQSRTPVLIRGVSN